MPDFLETIETIRAEEASVNRIFAGEGRSVRGLRRSDPRYIGQLAEAGSLIEDVLKGRRPTYHLQEAMTTSDFPLLFGDILDRTLLASYREAPYSWNKIVRQRTVNDFRTVKMFTMDGAESPLTVVPEQTEYPEKVLTEGEYELKVQKYGRRMAFSWEARINDDLDRLRDIPQRFGRAARRTEERLVTDLFVDGSGPDATFFSTGNGNRLSGNPALSITSLQAAMTLLAAQTDLDGDPITLDMVTLWVPPALEIPALNILNAVQVQIGDTTSTDPVLVTTNWMRNRMSLAVGTYIPHIASANGNTSWFLFAAPGDGRPAGMVATLRGHEEPEVWIKSPNAQRAGGGGGTVDAMDGDFDTDTIEYRVRAVFGAGLVDPKAAVASNGSGS